MGALVISNEVKARVAAAIARARAKPLPLEMIERATTVATQGMVLKLEDRQPGLERPPSEHVMMGSYRAAVSFEQQPAGLCIHLSISTAKPGQVPGREVCEIIAELYGVYPPDAERIWLEEFDPEHYAVNFLLLCKATH
jgi:hypothetical protein